MNEQQLAAVKQALGALKKGTGWMEHGEIITALQSIIAQHALDKKAENARELGLSYDDAVKGGVGIMLDGKRIDPASIYAEPAPVQEPVGEVSHHHWRQGLLYRDLQPGTCLYTTPPAAQKPWVGLSEEEKEFIELTGGKSDVLLAELVEAKLKEKNGGEA